MGITDFVIGYGECRCFINLLTSSYSPQNPLLFHFYTRPFALAHNLTPFLILQLADSAFPTGGFAHSNGLESAMKWGEVREGRGFEEFVRDSLMQAGRSYLPLVRAAHRGEPFEELDWLCDAFLNNHVANRASRRQGQAFLATTVTAFARPELERLHGFVRREKLPGHFAPVFGAVVAVLEVPEVEARRLFLFMTLRGLVSSAVRLNLIGPLQGQSIQYKLSSFVEEVAERCASESASDLVQTAPVIDMFQATHDRVYSRLFQS